MAKPRTAPTMKRRPVGAGLRQAAKTIGGIRERIEKRIEKARGKRGGKR